MGDAFFMLVFVHEFYAMRAIDKGCGYHDYDRWKSKRRNEVVVYDVMFL